MNSIISWVGGKKALRDLIYQKMPKEFGRYIEVFGGGGWVLFGRTPDAAMEVYNDFNSDLANLFRCVRDQPMAFLKELGFLPLNGRDEFFVLRKFLEQEEFTDAFMRQELELAQRELTPVQFDEIKAILLERAEMNNIRRAAAFFKVIRYSYGSGCTSYGCQPFDIRKTFDLIWQGSRRLKDTVIENKDFEELIKQYDRENAFIYCDPPYYLTEGHYAVEFRREDHFRLRDTLKGCQGKFLVSYNDCEFIRELYQDFRIETVSRLNNLAQRYDSGCEYAEVLISNYDTGERLRDLPIQLGLFDTAGLTA
ncbi:MULTISPECIES: DNA adenine methylase [Eubacteriales]|jgi:DNA adenine methylase|uniref:site-specific DNA-methyltransferase (adenine-specific) n=1 Tax=Caproicibacter fermentans TaxID=2576756 RepID=A0A7G8T8B9_9FIRM|nr:DNA adenine methylase [Caproicibacter fermentans]QNK39860.1 DNA adenine methylase [Caproicibacter fermentans]